MREPQIMAVLSIISGIGSREVNDLSTYYFRGVTMRNALVLTVVVVLGFGGAAQADIITGLEFHYEFENAANFAENSAGADGTVTGTITAATGPDGFGQAGNFGGEYDANLITPAAWTSPGTGGFTFAAWVDTTQLNQGGDVFLQGQNNAPGLLMLIVRNDDLLGVVYGADDNLLINSNGSVDDDGWHHIALTYTGTDGGADATARLYIDGVFDNSATLDVGNIVVDDGWNVGGGGAWGDQVAGSLDDVRGYTRALSAEDVAELVPEPSSFVLAAFGLLSVAFIGWRRRRR